MRKIFFLIILFNLIFIFFLTPLVKFAILFAFLLDIIDYSLMKLALSENYFLIYLIIIIPNGIFLIYWFNKVKPVKIIQLILCISLCLFNLYISYIRNEVIRGSNNEIEVLVKELKELIAIKNNPENLNSILKDHQYTNYDNFIFSSRISVLIYPSRFESIVSFSFSNCVIYYSLIDDQFILKSFLDD